MLYECGKVFMMPSKCVAFTFQSAIYRDDSRAELNIVYIEVHMNAFISASGQITYRATGQKFNSLKLEQKVKAFFFLMKSTMTETGHEILYKSQFSIKKTWLHIFRHGLS